MPIMETTAMRTVLRPTTKSNTSTTPSPDWKDLLQMKRATGEDDRVVVTLRDKREVKFPVSWSKPLTQATSQAAACYPGYALVLFWDEWDEGIGIENILFGEKLYSR